MIARLVILSCGLLAIVNGMASAAVVYDLATDWSNEANPNGVWSYNDSNGPIVVHQTDWAPHETFWSGQNAWANAATGPGHIVAWLKSEKDLGIQTNGTYDLAVGDVNTHTWDSNSSSETSNLSSVTWTAPVAGTYRIEGNLWQAFFEGTRSADGSVLVNGASIATVSLFDGDPYSRAFPFAFGPNTATMMAGEKVEIRLTTSSFVGTHVGVNLTVTRLAPYLEADFEEDLDVDGNDLAQWQQGFGVSGAATHQQGDADADLDVDGADFLIWQRQFGAVAVQSVPEPVAATTAGLLGLLAFRRRR